MPVDLFKARQPGERAAASREQCDADELLQLLETELGQPLCGRALFTLRLDPTAVAAERLPLRRRA